MENLITTKQIEQVCVVMRTLLSAMLDRPETLEITPQVSQTVVALRVRCDPCEVSKLIGKQGRTARALRTVLMAVARHSSFYLDIVECSPEVNHAEAPEAKDAVFCSQ